MSKTRRQKRRKGQTPKWMKPQKRLKVRPTLDEIVSNFRQIYYRSRTNSQKIRLIEDTIFIFIKMGVPIELVAKAVTRCMNALNPVDADYLVELWKMHENKHAHPETSEREHLVQENGLPY